MNKQYRVFPTKLFVQRLIFMAIAVFMLMPMSALFEHSWGRYVFTFSICFFYLPTCYSEAWQLANRDNKSYNSDVPYPMKGFVMGLISEIPTVLLLNILLIFYNMIWSITIPNAVYLAYNLPYLGMLGAEGENLLELSYMPLSYYACIFIVPLCTGIGYLAGCKKITVMDKILPQIVYKKPKRRSR